MKLHFTEKALQLIANKAMTKNTGARGLRAILESLLTDAMYEVNLVIVEYIIIITLKLAVQKIHVLACNPLYY